MHTAQALPATTHPLYTGELAKTNISVVASCWRDGVTGVSHPIQTER